jgi:hypothetical protein
MMSGSPKLLIMMANNYEITSTGFQQLIQLNG